MRVASDRGESVCVFVCARERATIDRVCVCVCVCGVCVCVCVWCVMTSSLSIL